MRFGIVAFATCLLTSSTWTLRSSEALFVRMDTTKDTKRCFLETIPKGGKLFATIEAERILSSETGGEKITPPVLEIRAEKVSDGVEILRRRYDPTDIHTEFPGDSSQEIRVRLCVVSVEDSSSNDVEGKYEIAFELRSLDADEPSPRDDIAYAGNVDAIDSQVSRVTDRIRDVKSQLVLYRVKESHIRSVAESNNSRVAWLSFGQAILLLLAGLWQVYHLKLYFRAKKLV